MPTRPAALVTQPPCTCGRRSQQESNPQPCGLKSHTIPLPHCLGGSAALLMDLPNVRHNPVHGPVGSPAVVDEARAIRTPNLVIWSHTRCRCAIAPMKTWVSETVLKVCLHGRLRLRHHSVAHVGGVARRNRTPNRVVWSRVLFRSAIVSVVWHHFR